ncbi:MAG: hypothetical protein JNK09_04990 [Prolixibacteraceae bacterium]|nr:hypothetical protein [Prolixibacteraceae bacterium]
MSRFLFFFIVGLFISFLSTEAQTRLGKTDFSRIRQKSIRNFLKDQMELGIVNFEDFQPSVTAQTVTKDYDSNVHQFQLERPLDSGWKAYLTAHPATVWQGKVVSCGMVYSQAEKKLIFPDDQYSGLEVGQIFFIEMRIFFRMIHFPVCFMVTNIDENLRQITFSYISTGSSKGAQTIQLIDSGKGFSQIIHSSIHQTENKLRDRTLYPIYHKKAIAEVHQNIQEYMR